MNAIRAHSRGGADTLRLEQIPIPIPDNDEVLIEVHAAAITYDELLWNESWTRQGIDRTPIIPSHEVSGTVAGLGPMVVDLSVGQDVYGLIEFDRDGAAAQYAVVPAVDLAPKPTSVNHVHAAALPLSALTAWQALMDHALLMPGESVLVTGGAGGVGGYLVQLAQHLGAHVTATIRTPDDADYVRRLGAQDVIVGEAAGTFDVVVDTVGGAALPAAYDCVRDGGRLVTLSEPPGPELRRGRDISEHFFVVHPSRDELSTIATLVDSGELKTLVGSVFDLADASAAYARRGRGGHPGKTVLRVR
jgi:NADPH:quinone reductase-like Zn-dependent oxidoreductase